MAYQYSDFDSQSTPAARLERLRLHKSEVSAQMGPSISTGGDSRSTAEIVEYLRYLNERETQLQTEAGTESQTRGLIYADLR